jgi:hypothetical protein
MYPPAVITNFNRCREVASLLQRMQLPSKLVRQGIFCSDRKTVGNFNLMLLAICHQTQNVMGTIDGKLWRGWDYLQRKLDAHSRSDPRFLEIDNWPVLSGECLDTALAPSPGTSAFVDVGSRAGLINDLGSHMIGAGYSSFEQLYKRFEGRCCGPHSILSFLRGATAYSDPNEKKARLLIGLLRDVHGWEFRDAHYVSAPVDYHEIRGHLRIGTVVINDSELKTRIQSDVVSGDEDNLIRSEVSNAIDEIASNVAGCDPLKVHYILWKYFRALCRRNGPSCLTRGEIAVDQLDQAFLDPFGASTILKGCAFSTVCDSFRRQVFPAEYSYGGSYY